MNVLQQPLLYSTVSIDSTILIFEINLNGIAVATRQAATDTAAASNMGNSGNAVSCKLS